MTRSLKSGVFLINAFVLALEIAFTRIFSVTMFYHFAFMAIGVALFGFGASGVVLYIASKRFSGTNLGRTLGVLSLLAGLTTIAALFIALEVNFNPNAAIGRQFLKLMVIYLGTAIPFFFAGLAIALVFQRLSKHIADLYYLSLTGSAFGCLAVIPLIQYAGGPGAILAISAIGLLGSLGFFLSHENRAEDVKIKTASKVTVGALIALLLALILLVGGFANPRLKIVQITHAKGYVINREKIEYDRWNAFSRIIVLHGLAESYYKGGIHNWGISKSWNLEEHPFPDQMWLEIDNTAGTPITHYTGEKSELEIAKYDITAVMHYLLDKPHVLVVGPGGGKDLLAALAFDSSKVDGAEINPLIGDAMEGQFADFSGHLYTRDPVHVTVSEGRTFIARSREKYDLIQISLIDTWAAASTGAYALSENNLYTVEAFREYFEHLAPNGIYSMSRFAFEHPRETLRVVSVARKALEMEGVTNPENCIIVLKQGVLANVMVRPDGYDETAIQKIREVIENLGFEILYLPGHKPESMAESIYNDLLSSRNPDNFYATYDLDIRPTTDDRPFFFYLFRPWEFMKALSFGKSTEAGYNSIAVFTLVSLLIISIIVTIIFILLPLLLFRRKDILERKNIKLKLLGYFICLGLAYILIEIGLMQHFTLFLGYPIYSLVAVLMSLLLFGGIGSAQSGKIPDDKLESGIRNAIIKISIIAAIYILVIPFIFNKLIVLPDFPRILITIILVLPLGFFMGQPFPLGLRIVERENLGVIPWAWGVNGAASVLGSALSLALAIALGYRLTLFIGIAVYLVGYFIILLSKRKIPA